ncbi:hypothetical protein R3P38DRAFT_3199089 [Favolaschia claudopus]|uniref:Uncharacterized protein n=1 Tax=Favolaschia claudopus TaxID=2862362 RepID=A0AAW0B110_9AGAR
MSPRVHSTQREESSMVVAFLPLPSPHLFEGPLPTPLAPLPSINIPAWSARGGLQPPKTPNRVQTAALTIRIDALRLSFPANTRPQHIKQRVLHPLSNSSAVAAAVAPRSGADSFDYLDRRPASGTFRCIDAPRPRNSLYKFDLELRTFNCIFLHPPSNISSSPHIQNFSAARPSSPLTTPNLNIKIRFIAVRRVTLPPSYQNFFLPAARGTSSTSTPSPEVEI